jgi:uncharacterized membrane protein YgcG
MAETNIKVLKIEVDTGTGEIKVNGVTKSIKEATAATKEFTKSAGEMKKSTEDLGSSAGIAGATVSELGRTISDLPYGITAISNNISQLGSLFAVLVNKVGGVRKAFQSLFATLRASPALLVLLAFQAAVAAMDFFAQKAREATKETANLNKSIGESATELKIAREILNDSTASLEQKKSVLSQVNKEYKDFSLVLDKNGIATAESTSKLNEQIAALERLAKSQAIVNQVQSLYGDIAMITAQTGEEAATFWDKLLAAFSVGPYEEIVNEFGEKTKQELIGKTQETVDALLKQLEVLFKDKKPKNLGEKALQDFNLMLIRSQIQYLESVNALTEENEVRRIEGINGLKLEELKILEDTAIEKAKKEGRSNSDLLLIQELYQNKRVALVNNGNKDILDAMKSFNTKLELDTQDYADDKHLDAMLETLLPAKEQVENRAKEITDGLAAYQKRREDAERNGNEAVQKLRIDNINKAAAALDTIANLAESAAGIMDAEFQKQMDLEQNKTTALNNQLRERLANEQLSANERKNIQSQISANDEALRIKQEAIAKKRFKTEKALRISVAIIDTASSALKAYASQLSIPTPDAPFRAAAAAAVATALGLAQVAMISKQQFLGSASASPAGLGGSSGGAGGVQAPDFNIVGQSPSNQIAAAVQGQFKQPIKAYVVSKDVSTAQEMDRNIVGSASLG